MPERITIAPQMPARPRVRDGYLPVYTYLEHRYASKVVLTFEQIESLLGFTLPVRAAGAAVVDQRDWERIAHRGGVDGGETDRTANTTGTTLIGNPRAHIGAAPRWPWVF